MDKNGRLIVVRFTFFNRLGFMFVFFVEKLFQFPLNNLKEFVGKSLDILLTDFV